VDSVDRGSLARSARSISQLQHLLATGKVMDRARSLVKGAASLSGGAERARAFGLVRSVFGWRVRRQDQTCQRHKAYGIDRRQGYSYGSLHSPCQSVGGHARCTSDCCATIGKRWKIERSIGWLANFRCLVVRWDHDIKIFEICINSFRRAKNIPLAICIEDSKSD
jgi:hypothetical protein